MVYTEEMKTNIADAVLACHTEWHPSGQRVYLPNGQNTNYAYQLVPLLLAYANNPIRVGYFPFDDKFKIAEALIECREEKFSCGIRIAFKQHGDAFYAHQLLDRLLELTHA